MHSPSPQKANRKSISSWKGQFLILLCILAHVAALQAQGDAFPRSILFATTYAGANIQIDSEIETPLGPDKVVLERFRYYVSDVELLQDDRVVARALPQHRLVDIESAESQVMSLEILGQGKSYNHLRFKLGVDSLTNVSGALGGDLDPTLGMYWAWQSGYVNFKIEGTTPLCPARNHRFQYHLGGYQKPFYALQAIDLPVEYVGQAQIVVRLPIEKLLPALNFQQDYEVMSPNAKALELSRTIGGLFEIAK